MIIVAYAQIAVVRKIVMSRPLQELLDEAALAVQPVLDELLREIEEEDV